MSTVTINGTLILNGDLTCDGDILVSSTGKIIPIPSEKSKEPVYSCRLNTYIETNGAGRVITSRYGSITVDGIIDGEGVGFEKDFGPGANSKKLDSLGFPIPQYGATHAGRGSVVLLPYSPPRLYMDVFTLTNDQAYSRSIRLPALPDDSTNVAMTIIKGTAQHYFDDFIVEENVISWSGKFIESILEPGDQVRIQYYGDPNVIYPPPFDPYGSPCGPTSLGSGSGWTDGGGAIHLVARSGLISIDGTVNMHGESGGTVDGTAIATGGASGGSIWASAWEITGSGLLRADGGTTDYEYGGGGAGGYIALHHERENSFDGTMTVDGRQGSEDGKICLDRIEPIFEEKFTGDILNVKWWEIIEEPVSLFNEVIMDSTQNDFRVPTLQSRFTLSGNNITADLDFLPDSSEINFYNSSFLLYIDDANWVGVARKYGHFYGVYSIDSMFSQSAIPYDYTSAVMRIRKEDDVFSFQFYDGTNLPTTIYSERIPELDACDFKIRMFLDKPDSSGIVHLTEYFSLNDDNIADTYVPLSGPPADSSEVALNVIGSSAQYYEEDFYTDGNLVKWDNTGLGISSGLEDLFVKGDQIRVIYGADTSINNIKIHHDNFKVYDGILKGIETTDPIIYVDSTYGDDYNTGLELDPLKNLFVATAWAKRGGIVVLRDGTHNPTEILRKHITIRGSNGGNSYITTANTRDTTGSGWERNAISFTNSQGIVKGVKLTDATVGVFIEHGGHVEIQNNSIYDVETGVQMGGCSDYNVVRHNEISNVNIAVDMSSAEKGVIYSNIMHDSSVGVRAFDASHINITGNTIDENDVGIILGQNSPGYISSNNLTNLGLGARITDSSPVQSINNNFYGTTTWYDGTPNFDASNIDADPLYVNPPSDYMLDASSPDIGAGTGEFDPYYIDFRGVNRADSTPVDIGAYEYIDGSHVGADYYVSTTGDDLVNFGGMSDPFRTLDRAMQVADSTIHIDGGHYDSYYLSLKSANVELNELTIYTSYVNHTISYYTLTASDMGHGYVALPGFVNDPADNSNIKVYLGVDLQQYQEDYDIQYGSVVWQGFDLDSTLVEGDTLKVEFNGKFYSKALNTFNIHPHFSNLRLDPGTLIFVSASGSDSTVLGGDGTNSGGDGSYDLPYRTVTKALEVSSEGDHIVVLAGEFPVFNGREGRVVVPLKDSTAIDDKYPRVFYEDHFFPRDFRRWNHVDCDPVPWELVGDPYFSSIGGGYISFYYNRKFRPQATSTFTFSNEFNVSADMRIASFPEYPNPGVPTGNYNDWDPLFFSVSNSDNTGTFMFDGLNFKASIFTGGRLFERTGVLNLEEREPEFFTDYMCITSEDVERKYVPLNLAPEKNTEVAVNILGGPAQTYGTDYIVSGARINWEGRALEYELEPGDFLRAVYIAKEISPSIRVFWSLDDGVLTVKVYDFEETATIFRKTLVDNFQDDWKCSFYMDG